MALSRDVLGDIVMWVLALLVVLLGYHLGVVVSPSGFIIIFLVLIIVIMAGYIMERGQGFALISLGLSLWFLIGFIPGLIVSWWSR